MRPYTKKQIHDLAKEYNANGVGIFGGGKYFYYNVFLMKDDEKVYHPLLRTNNRFKAESESDKFEMLLKEQRKSAL